MMRISSSTFGKRVCNFTRTTSTRPNALSLSINVQQCNRINNSDLALSIYSSFIERSNFLPSSFQYQTLRYVRWEHPKESPYTVLGVTKDSSQKDIKLAYFRLAKQYHPDINSEPSARLMFQKLANAYEILGDEENKKNFDKQSNFSWGGFSGDNSKASNAYNYQYESKTSARSYNNAEEVFSSVLEDISVISEAVVLYGKDFGDDMKGLGASILKGDMKTAGQFIYNNKIILLGITVPLVIATRSPLALVLTTRTIFMWSKFMVQSLVISGNATKAAEWIWKKTVILARERTNKEKEKRAK
jgi:hypothetical protein